MIAAGGTRLLVVGASGLVGGALTEQASKAGYRVLGAARRPQGWATRALDLTRPEQIESVLKEFEAQVVFVCSGYTHVDGCERDVSRSALENVQSVANLIAALRGSKAFVAFYSTDQVFDGSRDYFVESDPVHPLNVYSRHKREAEILLLERGQSLVVRSAWIFGYELQQKNFVYQTIRAADRGEKLKVPIAQSGNPTWSDWLASSTLELLQRGMSGVVHLSGSETLTKSDWARQVIRDLSLPPIEVLEVPPAEAGQVAPRPGRVVLKSERHSLIPPSLRSILELLKTRLARL